MEKIASFTINHIKLQPGVYVSRKDVYKRQAAGIKKTSGGHTSGRKGGVRA